MTTILGLDLGKFKSVSCLYHVATQEAVYATIDTDPDILRRHLEQLRPDLVVFETCTIAGWVADLCDALHLPRLVADPMNEAWRWSKVKRKTDRDDARKLARMAALGELPTAHVPSADARPYRGLIAYRHRLVGRRTAVRNPIRALCQAHGILLPAGQKAGRRPGVRSWPASPVSGRMPPPPNSGGESWLWNSPPSTRSARSWRTPRPSWIAWAETSLAVQLLETIPGVGRRTAEVIAAYLDDPQRFRTASEVSAYAGLAPRRFPSGQTDRQGRITKRGPRLPRAVLVESSWLVVRYNPWAAQLFTRLHRGQTSRRKTALVAVARKLLVRCWAMLRTGQPWRAEPVPACS